MRHPGVWSGVALAAALWSGPARSEALGDTLHSGKQMGTTCKECHFAFSKMVYLDVAILDKTTLLPAAQPLSPTQQYTFQVTTRFGMPSTFGAGFNLAVDNATTPAKSGTLLLHTGETGVRLMANEATHNAKRGSTADPVDTAETVRWLVDYQPPAIGGPPVTSTVTIKVFASVAKSLRDMPSASRTVEDVRSLSAVSNTRNVASAPECGPSTIQGFDPAACGIAFTVSTLPCMDVDGDGFLPAACYADKTNGGGDCDDAHLNVHPGATELCNGVDDNCDQAIDEGFHYVTAAVSMATPAQDGGLTDFCDDANDTDLCLNGTVVCKPDGSGTVCQGDFATPEICGNSVDDNCDGRVDETDAIVWNGLHYNEPCHSMAVAGMCKGGVVRCINQRPGCFGDMPTVEICGNGMDDDCDGFMDNGCPDAGVVAVSSSAGASGGNGSSGVSPGSSAAASGNTGGGGNTSGEDSSGSGNCACARAVDRAPLVAGLLLLVGARRRRRN